MNLKQIIKFYIHGLALTLVGLAFSYSINYIDVETDLGLTLSIILMFIVLPCSFALVNTYMFHKLHKVTIYTKPKIMSFMLDGLTLTILIVAVSIIISKICVISSLINIILSLLTPLIFGYSAYKLTQKLYNFEVM